MSEFNYKKYLANNPLLNEIELKYRSEDYIFDYIANDLFREKYGRTISFDELTDDEKDRVENSYDSYVDEDEPSGFYDRGMDVDESIKEGLKVGDSVTYDKTGEEFEVIKVNTDKLITGRDRQGEQKVLSTAHISKIDESINEMDLRKGDVVKFKDGSRITIVGPKGDGFDYMDGNEKGYHPAKWFAKMLSTGKAIILEEEELTFIPSSGTKAGGTFELNNRKYELTSPIKNVTIGGRYVTTLPKGTILYNLAGGLLADHESLRKFESRSNQYFDKSNYSGIMIRKDKEVLNNIIDNSKVIEFYG